MTVEVVENIQTILGFYIYCAVIHSSAVTTLQSILELHWLLLLISEKSIPEQN